MLADLLTKAVARAIFVALIALLRNFAKDGIACIDGRDGPSASSLISYVPPPDVPVQEGLSRGVQNARDRGVPSACNRQSAVDQSQQPRRLVLPN